jgi:hypothetical protein
MRLYHHIGPNFSLNKYANTGLPMSKKATHRAWGIKRNPITKNPLTKTLSNLSGAGWRRRRNEQGEVVPITQQTLNERRNR